MPGARKINVLPSLLILAVKLETVLVEAICYLSHVILVPGGLVLPFGGDAEPQGRPLDL